MLRTGLRRAWCVVAANAAACNVFDSSGIGTGGDGTDTGSGTAAEHGASVDESSGSDDAEACAAPSRCVEPAPLGWSGPFALAGAPGSDPAPMCPTGWNHAALDYRGLSADDATCGCECTPTRGSCFISIEYHLDSACTDVLTEVSVSGCQSVSAPSSPPYVFAYASVEGAGCTPSPMTSVPPLAWAEQVLLCSPDADTTCADGASCVPTPPPPLIDRWCVIAEGEHDCPVSEYSVAFVVHAGVTDTRDCTTCICEAGTADCDAGFTEYTDGFCLVAAGEHQSDGACQPSAIGGETAWSVSYDAAAPAITCDGNRPQAVGAATPTGTRTFCCQP